MEGQYLVLDGGSKKRGRKTGYRKLDAMTGKLSIRVPAELLEWLEGRVGLEGGSANDMARKLLLEAMMTSKGNDS